MPLQLPLAALLVISGPKETGWGGRLSRGEKAGLLTLKTIDVVLHCLNGKQAHETVQKNGFYPR